MGVGGYLLARAWATKVAAHPLEPANSPTLRTGVKVGKPPHSGNQRRVRARTWSISKHLDEVVDVWDGDAILMAQVLASQLGLAVGISSGANLLGALKVGCELGDGAVVGTVFCDSNKKYLSTDLCREEQPREGYLTPSVRFLGLRILPRVRLAP